jgi:AraC-like DNA-binding protein
LAKVPMLGDGICPQKRQVGRDHQVGEQGRETLQRPAPGRRPPRAARGGKADARASDLPIEAIANDVGYEDVAFFSRLFKRKMNLTLAQYRRRFGAMRRALEHGAGRARG